MILLVCSDKGGVGKSTIALSLAVERARKGRDVLTVDADPRQRLYERVARRTESEVLPSLSCVCLGGKTIAQEVLKLAGRYDDIVIDCGAGDSIAMRYAMGVCDTLLTPILPGAQEWDSALYLDDLVMQAKGANPNLRALVVINKVDTNPAIRDSADLDEIARAELEEMTVLNTKLRYRVAFRRSIADGLSVDEMDKKDPKAVYEIQSLYEEVYANE